MVGLLPLRDHNPPNGGCSRVAAGFCGRFHRCAGGKDIVAENDTVFDGLSRAEGAFEILLGAKIPVRFRRSSRPTRLLFGVARALKSVHSRKMKVVRHRLCDPSGLIEPALAFPAFVQGHRHHRPIIAPKNLRKRQAFNEAFEMRLHRPNVIKLPPTQESVRHGGCIRHRKEKSVQERWAARMARADHRRFLARRADESDSLAKRNAPAQRTHVISFFSATHTRARKQDIRYSLDHSAPSTSHEPFSKTRLRRSVSYFVAMFCADPRASMR